MTSAYRYESTINLCLLSFFFTVSFNFQMFYTVMIPFHTQDYVSLWFNSYSLGEVFIGKVAYELRLCCMNNLLKTTKKTKSIRIAKKKKKKKKAVLIFFLILKALPF